MAFISHSLTIPARSLFVIPIFKRLCLRCVNIRIFSSQKVINTSITDSVHGFADRRRNTDIHTKSTKYSKKSSRFSTEIANINQCKSSQNIIHIINNNTTHYEYDNEVYISAIQRCGELFDINACEEIMKILSNSNSITNKNPINIKNKKMTLTAIYNALFLAFSLNDVPWKCNAYFEQMTENNIQPNIETTKCWLTAYQRRNISAAEVSKIWESTVVKYNLYPDAILCRQRISIESRNGNISEAEKWFENMKMFGYQPNVRTIATLLTMYANHGQIQKMEELKNNCYTKYKIKLNPIHFMCIMGGYFKCKTKNYKALEMYDECIRIYGQHYCQRMSFKFPMYKHIGLVNQFMQMQIDCYLRMDGKSEILLLYKTIMNTKLNILDGENINCEDIKLCKFQLGNRKLKASIHFFNYEYGNIRLLNIFRELCNEHNFGYWTILNGNKSVIDLHGYNFICAEFVLYYILHFERENIQEMKDEIYILCGKGSHSNIKQIRIVDDSNFREESDGNEIVNGSENMKNIDGMLEFIQQTLLGYKPPISSSVLTQNKAILQLNRTNVDTYFASVK